MKVQIVAISFRYIVTNNRSFRVAYSQRGGREYLQKFVFLWLGRFAMVAGRAGPPAFFAA
jgi:hypothetical protein